MTTLDHVLEAFGHLSLAVVNMSSLAKFSDRETFNLVLQAAFHPLIQVNILPHFLNLMQAPQPETLAEASVKKVEATV